MLCLNIRTTNAMIGMHSSAGELEIQQPAAELHRDYEAPRSSLWPDGVEVEIDQYPCRRAYGYATTADSLREYQQKGLQDVIAGIARRAREGTEVMKHFGDYNVLREQARRKIFERKQTPLEFQMIPEPEITVRQKPMQGNMDTGQDKMSITAHPTAEEQYTPVPVEFYLKQNASIHMWVTEGKYDIYA